MWHTCMSLTVKAWLLLPRATREHHPGYVIGDYVMAAASASRETMLWLPCQPGENKRVCSGGGDDYGDGGGGRGDGGGGRGGFSSLLPAS